MKRFWLVLLSLALVMAFSVSALAVDVKVSGEYFAGGLYLANNNVKDDDSSNSTAFFYQRLRVGTDFIVSPGLKLVTRFDAMERIWGGARGDNSKAAADSAGTRFENENIAFDFAYIDYVSPIGIFDIGLMEDGRTGTVFGNSYSTLGRIKWKNTFGPVTIGADITKSKEQSYSVVAPAATATDTDNNKYGLEGVYSWKDGKAGMKVTYYRYAENRKSAENMKTYFLFTPYAIAKIGPVALQAELNYATGKNKKFDDGVGNQTLESYSAFVDATATFVPVYVGATLAYLSGDDPTTSKNEGTLNGGNDWNPCLIMFNYYDVANWAGTVSGYGGSAVTGPMTNAIFAQGRVGVKPIPELDAVLSVSYATADEKPAGYNGDYGWEVDLTGTYKITNNLSYMLGIGYLFTGDYFKAGSTQDINDDYIMMNKLTLTF